MDSEVFRVVAAAVRGRCALLVPVTRFGDATRIGAATADLDGPVVLLGCHYSQAGDCLAALERWPHLLLETSRLAHFGAVDSIVRAVGAQRLLFGSGAPVRPIKAALNAVLAAHISDLDRRAILADNASHVFGVPAEPFEMPPTTRAADLIDCRRQSERLRRRGREHGQRLRPRRRVGRQAALPVERPAHRQQRLSSSDTRGGEARTAAEDPRGWGGLGRGPGLHGGRYPEWKLIVAHGGPGTPSREGATLVARTPNVYLELSTSFADLPVTRQVVRTVGPQRLLFGSDAPLLDPAYVLGLYADAGADLARTPAVAREVFDL